MSRIISKRRFQDMFFFSAVLLMLLGLILFPSQSVTAAKNGVELCLNVIVPSLFPFFALSTLCVELGMLSRLGRCLEGVMYPLFHVGGGCSGAFLLGILGGYPVGARTAIALYQKGQCTKDEAERLLSFCNNSGPAFILGVVGAGIFSSSVAGLLLYGAHVLSSVLVGILFRGYGNPKIKGTLSATQSPVSISFPDAFTASVKNAFSATLNICAFVIFFTVVIRLLFLSGVITYLAGFLSWLLSDLGVKQEVIESILTGLIEMTSGVWSLRDMAASLGSRLCMAAFILGWAGLSVHCQVLSFIGQSGLSTRTYFFGKLLHGAISALLIFLLSQALHWNAPVSKYLATQVSTIAGLQFSEALAVSTVTALVVWGILTVISLGQIQKEYGKGQKFDV